MIGETLARFRVTARLGAGGMGEVYRATDEKLGRQVAIKVLPEDLAHDPERLARFEREAQLLASLNHPNIATIHGLEEAEGKPFLVLELVEGEDLADRMQRGAIPPDEAMEIARQIAEALAEAHERGIVHRDLKPANVKIAPDGKVKVLDFGLAKALAPEAGDASSPDQSQSPTLTAQATAAGVILGTAAYMAPEQARGRPVDRRADIWALGVVLFEMLTGRRLFEGETISDVLAAVLKTEVDWSALPAGTPAGLRRLLRRCLERDPRRRLHSAADARLEIEAILAGESDEAPSASAAPAGAADRRPWLLATMLGAAFLAMVAREALLPETRQQTTLLTVQLSADEPLASLFGANAVLSPDGRTIAYVTGSQGDSLLHVRRLDEPEGRGLPGTDGARSPFFSPDGRWIGFMSQGSLMKVGVDGGPPVRLSSLEGPQGRGATWADNRIAFAPGFTSSLSLVSAEGGAAEPLTELDAARDERSHRWPWFLPGGSAVLFMVQQIGEDYDDADIEAVALADGRRHALVQGGAYPRFVAPDTLLFVRGCVLYAQRLDPQTLTISGPPQPVLENLATWTGDQETGDGSAEYALSADGDLLYRTGGECDTTRDMRLVWIDRDGQEQPAFEVPFRAYTLEVSPDGRRVLLQGRSSRGRGVFVHDLERGTLTPMTTEGGGESDAIWSPDDRQVAYMPRGSGQRRGVTIQTLDGSESARAIPAIATSSAPTSWTPDGRALLVEEFSADTATDIWLLPLDGSEPHRIVASPREDAGGRISPDGRWVAYYSEEKGDGHVFVTRLDGTGPRWQVSFEPAAQPKWSRDGHFLYFVGTGGAGVGDQGQESPLLEVAVEDTGSALRFSQPRIVHSGFIGSTPATPIYDTHPDGRLLLIERESQDVEIDRSHAVLALGWREELRRRMEDATR